MKTHTVYLDKEGKLQDETVEGSEVLVINGKVYFRIEGEFEYLCTVDQIVYMDVMDLPEEV